jgi:hypothetical protein
MGRIATHMGAWDRIARFELRLARGARQAVPGDLT